MFDTSLAGRIAVLQMKPELVEKDPKRYSSYYDGEYFVIRATRQALTCVKLADGYGAHDTKTFMASRYDVVDAYDDHEVITDWLSDLAYFAGALGREEKLQWVSSVYSGAASVVRQARRAFERRQEVLAAEGEKSCDMASETAEEPSLVVLRGYDIAFIVHGTVEGIVEQVGKARFISDFMSFVGRDGETIHVLPGAITAVYAAEA